MAKVNSQLYDVFISYSSEDYEWASAIFNNLVAKGLQPFLDKERLQPGLSWESQLVSALNQSRHILVVWSHHAAHSEWVRRETSYFDWKIHSQPEGTALPGRMVFLLLEGDAKAYASMQMITDLKEQGAYKSGIQAISKPQWKGAIEKIERAIKDTKNTLHVPLLILSTTHDRLASLGDQHKPSFAHDLETMLRLMDIPSKDDLLQYYGNHPTNWRPFCSSEQITDILDSLKDEINQLTSPIEFDWEPLNEEFWSSDYAAMQHEVNRLLTKLCVIVIDPLSLYDPEVRDRLNHLDACFDNENAIIMVLAPFAMPEPYAELRKLVQHMAKRLFDHFYDPPMYKHFATCSVHVSDEMDIKRLLLSSLKSQTEYTQPTSVPRYLRF